MGGYRRLTERPVMFIPNTRNGFQVRALIRGWVTMRRVYMDPVFREHIRVFVLIAFDVCSN